MKWSGSEASCYFSSQEHDCGLTVPLYRPSFTLNWLKSRGTELIFEILGSR